MKLYVKRDRLKKYQAGKIVFQSSDDWTTLTMALTNAMEFCKAQRKWNALNPIRGTGKNGTKDTNRCRENKGRYLSYG